jgi:hypothetical protein
MSIWLSSIVGLQIGLSESGTPLLFKCGVRSQHSGFTIASEEIWTGFIESLLIGPKAKLNKLNG